MPNTAAAKRKLILITGIPATGKTKYGEAFASQFGFAHYDLEREEVRNQFFPDPLGFIESILQGERSVVVTWGFSRTSSKWGS